MTNLHIASEEYVSVVVVASDPFPDRRVTPGNRGKSVSSHEVAPPDQKENEIDAEGGRDVPDERDIVAELSKTSSDEIERSELEG